MKSSLYSQVVDGYRNALLQPMFNSVKYLASRNIGIGFPLEHLETSKVSNMKTT